jgi:hypothetical protein
MKMRRSIVETRDRRKADQVRALLQRQFPDGLRQFLSVCAFGHQGRSPSPALLVNAPSAHTKPAMSTRARLGRTRTFRLARR